MVLVSVKPMKAYVAPRRAPSAVMGRVAAFRRPRPMLDHEVMTVENPLADLMSPVDSKVAVEEASKQAFEKIDTAYRMAERQALREAMTDSPLGFYRVLVFGNNEQADAFARAVGQDVDMQFIDGRRVCDRLGIALPPDTWKTNRRFTAPDRRVAALATPLTRGVSHGEETSTQGEEARRQDAGESRRRPRQEVGGAEEEGTGGRSPVTRSGHADAAHRDRR
jgi:hypothetical protein